MHSNLFEYIKDFLFITIVYQNPYPGAVGVHHWVLATNFSIFHLQPVYHIQKVDK